MATLALAAAGAAIGSAALPAGLTVLGATLSGATVGMQIGSLAGRAVDQALFSASGQSRAVEGPRLQSLHVTASSEGAAIPRLYGRARLGGQVIWAADMEEEVVTSEAGGGGKGGGSGSSSTTTDTSYLYYGSFAVAIAEGTLTTLGRVFADGQEMSLEGVSYRFHRGTEDQAPDSLIAAYLGEAAVPAFRGVAYIVFERLPLARYGNRLPQLTFEVSRGSGAVAGLARAMVMIPGSGEFAYATEPVTRAGFAGERIAENVHTRRARTDWAAAVEQLAEEMPLVRRISLAVSWFGTDLRAGACLVRPAVDRAAKQTQPSEWVVAGIGRADAAVVSLHDGRPAYGGTPSDHTVVQAIRDLKARGHAVTLTPFLLMDIPAGNGLADPVTGGVGQPAYPWRGRITVDPGAGRPQSADRTAAAAEQIAAFLGDAAATGWSYRRFILHYAQLAADAGGVDAFVIGSEMRALTTARDANDGYPFVAGLMQLGVDVKAILGAGTQVTYAADWSEYLGHQPADGSGDVRYHLDALWASPAIDAVGIDAYFPLADWREGTDHRDALDGWRSVYDLDYLKSRLRAGEGFDWYYASDADREAQRRTAITDGLAKPWVFRPKDIVAWWSNPHHERTGGVEAARSTAWVPQSKPIWLMELGCGAIDLGANQPNLFYDPKSSENALPSGSTGERDDLIQRRVLQAWLEAIDPAHPGAVAGLNPISTVYGAPMIDLAHVYLYCWDARPYPAFPFDTTTWGDGDNWSRGHWLTGRLAGLALDEAVAGILDDHGFYDHDTHELFGIVPGYVVERVMSAREALQPLELAYFFDSVETGGRIRTRHRGSEGSVLTLTADDLVEAGPDAALSTLTRKQDTDLPAAIKLSYISGAHDYRSAVAEARRMAGTSQRISQAEVPLVLPPERAWAIAESWLHEAWAARDAARFQLPPSALQLEPGDVVTLEVGASPQLFRVTEIGEHGARDISALSIDPSVYAVAAAPSRPAVAPPIVAIGQPDVEILELPRLRGSDPEVGLHVAASRQPWPGSVAIYRSPETTGYQLAALATRPATLGTTLDALPAGVGSRRDVAARLRVRLDSGALRSITPLQMLAGGNAFGLRNSAGVWEVLQAETATLVAPQTYELSGLIRGQAGTEAAIEPLLAAGARLIVLDSAVTTIDLGADRLGLEFNWRIGPAAQDIGNADYVGRRAMATGVALRPLSPVHLRGVRNAAGDLVLSWVRRTRISGDSWDVAEVPLGEASEAYEVDVLASGDAGASVMRSLRVEQSSAIYTAADQTADFGSRQASVVVRVSQLSALVGRGAAVTAVV